jgi:hypothetical protein
MRRLALGQRFDAVIVSHGLFHLPHDDQRAMSRRQRIWRNMER